MKIVKVEKNKLTFDNGNTITAKLWDIEKNFKKVDNYADFEAIETLALGYDFDEKLTFEALDSYGFRFGDGNVLFFIPCFSIQDGYSINMIDIYYNDTKIIRELACKTIKEIEKWN